MRVGRALAAIALAVTLGQAGVLAPQVAVAAEQGEAEIIAGVVTKIDLDQRRVTVRSSDGAPHEFEASEETLKDLKVGDHIEAKRRRETQ